MIVACIVNVSPEKRPGLPMTVRSGPFLATIQSFSLGGAMENPCIMMRGGSLGCDAQAPRKAQSMQAINPCSFISGTSPVSVWSHCPTMAASPQDPAVGAVNPVPNRIMREANDGQPGAMPGYRRRGVADNPGPIPPIYYTITPTQQNTSIPPAAPSRIRFDLVLPSAS